MHEYIHIDAPHTRYTFAKHITHLHTHTHTGTPQPHAHHRTSTCHHPSFPSQSPAKHSPANFFPPRRRQTAETPARRSNASMAAKTRAKRGNSRAINHARAKGISHTQHQDAFFGPQKYRSSQNHSHSDSESDSGSGSDSDSDSWPTWPIPSF